MTKLDELKSLMAAIETQEPMAEYTVVGIKTLSALIAAVEALQEISKGAGEFSIDPFEHAKNCIHDMKAIAHAALKPFGE